EAGSRGLDNYLEFYGFLIEERRPFLRHWLDRVYYDPPTDPVVLVNYVKNDENIYRFRSRLPGNFSSGVWITLVWILVFLGISFTPFNRRHKDLTPEEMKELNRLDWELKPGEPVCFLMKGFNALSHLFYRLLSGQYRQLEEEGFAGNLIFNGKNMAKEKNPYSYLFLCGADRFPRDIKIRHLVWHVAHRFKVPRAEVREFLNRPGIKPFASKTLGQLQPKKKDKDPSEKIEQQFDAMLSLAKIARGCQVFCFDDVTNGYPVSCSIKLFDYMEQLSQEAMVISLVNTDKSENLSVAPKNIFGEGDGWLWWVTAQKRLSKKQRPKNNKEQIPVSNRETDKPG
ncbi:MAG: hypothetical protein GY940_22490, partial [bacterium]|nr:hypothetical protein [bacterium]